VLRSCREPLRESAVLNTSKTPPEDPFPPLQAFMWDWLMSMPDEYETFRRSRFSMPVVAYFLSRSVLSAMFEVLSIAQGGLFSVGTLGFCISATTFQGDSGNFAA
jgi:hypothetical protein